MIAKKGRDERRRGNLILETETTDVRSLRAGKVEVKGEARREADATKRTRISQDEALVTKTTVEEYESDSDSGGSWRTIYEEEECVSFIVDDGTGEVRVDPTHPDARLDLDMETVEVGTNDEPSDEVRRFIEREDEVGEASRGSIGPLSYGDRRRYSEGAVEPGDEVYVLGNAREEDSGWDRRGPVIDEPIDSGDFIISDKSEEQLAREGQVKGVLLMFFGGFFAFLGGVFTIIGLIMMV